MTELGSRAEQAREIAREAGIMALDFFARRTTLNIDRKGHQDFVTEADRSVERLVRARLAERFPDDAIVGEEDEPTAVELC